MDLAIQITLMTWMPTPDEEYVLYILAGMWGFTDGIWQTQINGKYLVIHRFWCRMPSCAPATCGNCCLTCAMGEYW